MRRRVPRELMKRPSHREQALIDGMRSVLGPSRRARSRMLPRTKSGLHLRPGRTGEQSPVRYAGRGTTSGSVAVPRRDRETV